MCAPDGRASSGRGRPKELSGSYGYDQTDRGAYGAGSGAKRMPGPKQDPDIRYSYGGGRLKEFSGTQGYESSNGRAYSAGSREPYTPVYESSDDEGYPGRIPVTVLRAPKSLRARTISAVLMKARTALQA